MTAEQIIDRVLKFLIDFRRSPQLSASADSELLVDNRDLTFSLQGLWRSLFSVDACCYADFQRALYASDINGQLADIAAQLIIDNNSGKLITNRYRLCDLEKTSYAL